MRTFDDNVRDFEARVEHCKIELERYGFGPNKIQVSEASGTTEFVDVTQLVIDELKIDIAMYERVLEVLHSVQKD